MSLRRCVERLGVRAPLAGAALLTLTISLSGCASDEERRREAYAQAAQARYEAARQRQQEPELEDDGLPSQVAPPARRNVEPDDPREPYSPNYGRTGSAPASQRAAAAGPLPGPGPARRSATY